MCEKFIYMDSVQYTKNSMYSKNYINGQNGKVCLPIPIKNETKYGLIKDVKICNDINWGNKHLNKIRHSYSRSPYFECYFSSLENILNKQWDWLTDVNYNLLMLICDWFDLTAEIYKESDLNICWETKKNGRILEYCTLFKANQYIFGKNGANYADEKLFQDNNVKLHFQNFKHPIYRQFGHELFTCNLSFIDLLFNCEREQAKKMLFEVNERFTDVCE